MATHAVVATFEPKIATFTKFPELPIELRLKICRHAFPEPRAVDIGYLNVADMTNNEFDEVVLGFGRIRPGEHMKAHWKHYVTDNPPVPTIMHVNREFRIETLKHYCVVYKQDILTTLPWYVPEGWYQKEKPICFNVSRDTLKLCPEGMRHYCDYFLCWFGLIDRRLRESTLHQGLCGVRFLSLYQVDWIDNIDDLEHIYPLLQEFMRQFSGLSGIEVSLSNVFDSQSIHELYKFQLSQFIYSPVFRELTGMTYRHDRETIKSATEAFLDERQRVLREKFTLEMELMRMAKIPASISVLERGLSSLAIQDTSRAKIPRLALIDFMT